MDEIVIRDAKIEDINEMAIVRQKVWDSTYRGIYSDDSIDNFDYNYAKNSFIRKVENPNLMFKVATLDNKIVGYVCFGYATQDYKDYKYELVYMHILKDYQGLGLGRKFFNLIIDYARENNIGKFFVICNKHNYNAHKYYEKMGGTKDYVDPDLGNKQEEKIIYTFEVGSND
jgi:ribosomal protein S18 acetylase RimI-like enzyme